MRGNYGRRRKTSEGKGSRGVREMRVNISSGSRGSEGKLLAVNSAK